MKHSLFRERGAFVHSAGYRLLPFRFMRWDDDEVFVTQDAGEFHFLKRSEFEALVSHSLDEHSETYRSLKAKHFLWDSGSVVPLELLSTKYRTKKSFLDGFTRLQIFVATLRCDHSCSYCQVSRVTQNRSRYDMSRETALRAIDLMFESPAPAFKVEFQGGEPLLNFELVRWVVETVEQRSQAEGRPVDFVVATNLAPLSDEMLSFFGDHSVSISTSIDGPLALHNRNRPRPGGNSYELAVANIARARSVLGEDRVAALMTATRESLQCPGAIIDEYARLGFDAVFLRPISPYGFAVRTGLDRDYKPEDFAQFYETALKHVVELNRNGMPFMEIYSQILLQKMLTPFPTGYVDLQSPAGIGIGVVVYNFDGDVYASDEGRMLAAMGDHSFRLGNVHSSTYRSMFGSELLHSLIEQSCHETLPGCSECAFSPYCGADPVFNWATQHDPVGHRPTSAFCARQMAMIRHLLKLLRGEDAFVRELLVGWATQLVTVSQEPIA